MLAIDSVNVDCAVILRRLYVLFVIEVSTTSAGSSPWTVGGSSPSTPATPRRWSHASPDPPPLERIHQHHALPGSAAAVGVRAAA
jgi:hypothetical protein